MSNSIREKDLSALEINPSKSQTLIVTSGQHHSPRKGIFSISKLVPNFNEFNNIDDELIKLDMSSHSFEVLNPSVTVLFDDKHQIEFGNSERLTRDVMLIIFRGDSKNYAFFIKLSASHGLGQLLPALARPYDILPPDKVRNKTEFSRFFRILNQLMKEYNIEAAMTENAPEKQVSVLISRYKDSTEALVALDGFLGYIFHLVALKVPDILPELSRDTSPQDIRTKIGQRIEMFPSRPNFALDDKKLLNEIKMWAELHYKQGAKGFESVHKFVKQTQANITTLIHDGRKLDPEVDEFVRYLDSIFPKK